MIHPCNFKSKIKKKRQLAQFLEKYGDSLPKSAIKKATTSMLDHAEMLCNEHNEIIASAQWEKNDWYLCTLRYAATHPDYRGKGIASQITDQVIANAKKAHNANNEPSCLVLAADVTTDNIASKKILIKRGFRPVTQFNFDVPQKRLMGKTDILHFVLTDFLP